MGQVEAESFLDADIVFRLEGQAYRCTKSRFGEYPKGLSFAETRLVVNALCEEHHVDNLKVYYDEEPHDGRC